VKKLGKKLMVHGLGIESLTGNYSSPLINSFHSHESHAAPLGRDLGKFCSNRERVIKIVIKQVIHLIKIAVKQGIHVNAALLERNLLLFPSLIKLGVKYLSKLACIYMLKHV
jgi:hypothetical protein